MQTCLFRIRNEVLAEYFMRVAKIGAAKDSNFIRMLIDKKYSYTRNRVNTPT